MGGECSRAIVTNSILKTKIGMVQRVLAISLVHIWHPFIHRKKLHLFDAFRILHQFTKLGLEGNETATNFNGLMVPLFNSTTGTQMNQTTMEGWRIVLRFVQTRAKPGMNVGAMCHVNQPQNSFVRNNQLEVSKRDILVGAYKRKKILFT